MEEKKMKSSKKTANRKQYIGKMKGGQRHSGGQETRDAAYKWTHAKLACGQ